VSIRYRWGVCKLQYARLLCECEAKHNRRAPAAHHQGDTPIASAKVALAYSLMRR